MVDFLSAGVQVLPFIVLAVLAYLGSNRLWARIATFLWLAIVLLGFVLFCTLYSVLAVIDPASVQMVAPDSSVPFASPQLLPGGLQQVVLVFFVVMLAGGVGLLCLVPAVRRWLARFLPIDPDSFVHTIALVTVVAFSLMACVPLLMLGYPPILAPGAIALLEQSMDVHMSGALQLQIYTMAWTIAASFFIVGFAIRRSFRETLQRLGLEPPTLKQVLWSMAFVPLLVFAVLALGKGIEWLWNILHFPITNEDALEVIFRPSFTPVGALISSVTAGVGEELAVRGVLQPRVGIFLSNFFFASLHALQYSWDGFLIVFVVGLVFALIRRRSTTTVCAILHAGYDLLMFSVVMLGI